MSAPRGRHANDRARRTTLFLAEARQGAAARVYTAVGGALRRFALEAFHSQRDQQTALAESLAWIRNKYLTNR